MQVQKYVSQNSDFLGHLSTHCRTTHDSLATTMTPLRSDSPDAGHARLVCDAVRLVQGTLREQGQDHRVGAGKGQRASEVDRSRFHGFPLPRAQRSQAEASGSCVVAARSWSNRVKAWWDAS